MLKLRTGFLYGILVSLLVIMGVWWVYYLTTENLARTQTELQKLANDRIHATFLVQTDPQVRADPEHWLGESFPDLVFHHHPDGSVDVAINPETAQAIRSKGAQTQRMFISEGLFFLILLAAGSGILIHAWRSEIRYKQSRELFLAGATHEFKTPLASLRLYTETLGREGLQEHDRLRIRHRMLDDMTRLEEMVDSILATSAADLFSLGQRTQLDLAEECQNALSDLQGFAEENQAEFHYQGEKGALILGHRLPLTLALRNLLVNAVQHSPAPVRVDVSVLPGHDRHRVVVQDNGPGIPVNLQEKVFECFYSNRKKGPTSGSGLGLYLVKRNISILEGTVSLVSKPGQGCTFSLEFPVCTPNSQSA